MQYLLGLAGVAGVEVRPAIASVVIVHEGGMKTRAAILDALRGGQTASTLPLTGSAEHGDAAETASHDDGPVAEAPGPVAECPYARCELFHALRGRVRLRIPVLRTDGALAGVLAQYMEQQAGVQQVRLNAQAANLIVTFDPAALDVETIMARVTAYEPEPATVARWQAAQVVPHQRPELHRQRRRLELALAGGALVVGLVEGASFALLVLALLLVAIG